MRITVLIAFAGLLLTVAGCKRNCMCCGQGYIGVTCNKDTTSFTVMAYTSAGATDSSNYYTGKGFVCTVANKLYPNSSAQKACGNIAIKDLENGGLTCAENDAPSNNCQP